MDQEKIRKIEYAFSLGASIEEAALEADCTRLEVIEWMAKDGNKDKVDKLLLTPKWNAKKSVALDLKEVKTAQWFLERKDPEFKPKQDLTSGDEKFLINLNV